MNEDLENKDILRIDNDNFLLFKAGNSNIADSVNLFTRNEDDNFYTHDGKYGRIKCNGEVKQRLELFRDMIESYILINMENEKQK